MDGIRSTPPRKLFVSFVHDIHPNRSSFLVLRKPSTGPSGPRTRSECLIYHSRRGADSVLGAQNTESRDPRRVTNDHAPLPPFRWGRNRPREPGGERPSPVEDHYPVPFPPPRPPTMILPPPFLVASCSLSTDPSDPILHPIRSFVHPSKHRTSGGSFFSYSPLSHTDGNWVFLWLDPSTLPVSVLPFPSPPPYTSSIQKGWGKGSHVDGG